MGGKNFMIRLQSRYFSQSWQITTASLPENVMIDMVT